MVDVHVKGSLLRCWFRSTSGPEVDFARRFGAEGGSRLPLFPYNTFTTNSNDECQVVTAEILWPTQEVTDFIKVEGTTGTLHYQQELKRFLVPISRIKR